MATKTGLVATLLLLFLSVLMSANAVEDTDGNPINEQSQYYIVPVDIGSHGVLGRSPSPDLKDGCPLYVTESYSGEAVKLVVARKTQNQMMSSGFSAGESVYYINSGKNASCRSHGYWYGGLDVLTRRLVFFGTGDIYQDSWITKFSMEKVQTPDGIAAYKMSTCLSKDLPICGYVGRFDDQMSGLKMLTIVADSMAPLHVVFIKKDGQKTPFAAAS